MKFTGGIDLALSRRIFVLGAETLEVLNGATMSSLSCRKAHLGEALQRKRAGLRE